MDVANITDSAEPKEEEAMMIEVDVEKEEGGKPTDDFVKGKLTEWELENLIPLFVGKWP